MLNDVTISDGKLGYCKSIRNLGVIFDENLNFEEHERVKMQKVYGALNRFRHTKHFIPNYIKREIATALIDCNGLWDYYIRLDAHGTQNHVQRELVAGNDKIRYICGLKCNAHHCAS